MQQVYELASVTISATCADGAEAGFLRARPSAINPRTPFPDASEDSETSDLLIDSVPSHPFFPVITDSPMETRGWIVQECLLSPRVLYYGKELLSLECRTCDYYEHR